MKLNALITSKNTSVNKDTIPAIYTKLAKHRYMAHIYSMLDVENGQNISKDLLRKTQFVNTGTVSTHSIKRKNTMPG